MATLAPFYSPFVRAAQLGATACPLRACLFGNRKLEFIVQVRLAVELADALRLRSFPVEFRPEIVVGTHRKLPEVESSLDVAQIALHCQRLRILQVDHRTLYWRALF